MNTNLSDALEAFKKLNNAEANYVLKALLHEEKINIPQLVSAYATYLQDFKHDAENDIRNLAEAGLTLARKEIKKIPSMKPDNTRQLYTALAHTLLQAGFRETKYNEELSAKIDMSIVNQDWYEDSWKLKTIKEK